MARSRLLNSYDPMFTWEHFQIHRGAFGVMAPLDRFSVIPYLLDPAHNQDQPAGDWHLRHQQAHSDALEAFPSYYGATVIGLRVGQNLIDWNLSNARQVETWTFMNHMEHLLGSDTILPAPSPGTDWIFPFG